VDDTRCVLVTRHCTVGLLPMLAINQVTCVASVHLPTLRRRSCDLLMVLLILLTCTGASCSVVKYQVFTCCRPLVVDREYAAGCTSSSLS